MRTERVLSSDDGRSASPAEESGERALPRLLILPEVATFLSVSLRTVRRLVAARQLRCVRLGRSVRFDPADVFRFVAGRRE